MISIHNSRNGIKVVREASYTSPTNVRKQCPWHGDCFKCRSAYECEQSEALKQLHQVMV